MSIARGLILNKEVYRAVTGFEGKFSKDEAKSKKLSEGSEGDECRKSPVEFREWVFQFKLDALVAGEADLKAKYEIKLKAAAENLKKAQDQKMTTEAAQKLVKDRTFAVETAVSLANSSFKAMVAEKDKQLAEAREEMEKVKAKRAKAEVKAVMSFKEEFSNMPEFLRLANLFMTAGGEQLVKRIGECHLEWDILFLRHAPADLLAQRILQPLKFFPSTDTQAECEAHTTRPIIEECPQCAIPREEVGQ
ncbi:hypothetical protein Adt_45003 [Abeliophyllum distichum]|uniref:Uncharacterized protein n=1 Tax=Abeliophyllum distichum TaxID=126358 RepID=A0ABD1PCG4_9LAMI